MSSVAQDAPAASSSAASSRFMWISSRAMQYEFCDGAKHHVAVPSVVVPRNALSEMPHAGTLSISIAPPATSS